MEKYQALKTPLDFVNVKTKAMHRLYYYNL